MQRPSLFIILLLLGTISLGTALGTGSIDLTPGELWAVLLQQGTPLHQSLVMELRLPRALAAFVTGGLLALAGTMMQILLRNPLADPYILGVSGGASVAALIGMVAGLSGLLLSLTAFGGAICSMLLVFSLARITGSWDPNRLLLTGVVIAAGWGAVISFILATSPEQNLRGMLFWLMGDVSYSHTPLFEGCLLMAVMLLALPFARNLNLLALGELQAGALGVSVEPLRMMIYICASLLTASAVTLSGSIGFVGLIVPHMLRLVAGSDHRMLLPASVLLGGSLLVLADTLARTIVAPNQLPVGVLTAMLGVPVFLALMYRSR